MRAGLHIFLCRVLLLPAIVGSFVVWLYVFSFLGDAVGVDGDRAPWLSKVGFLAVAVLSFISGIFLTEWLFRAVIPARCPRCGGRFRLKSWRKKAQWTVYMCDACGHRWEWKSTPL